MATARLVPGAYTLSSTTYLTISDAANMYTNTDSTTYGQVTHNRNSSTAYYLYLHNFNFGDVPDDATVNSFTVKIRGLESALSTNSSYRMSLYNNTTSISNTTVSSSLSTTATTFTFPNGNLTWSTLKGYGNNFRIRVPLRRNSSSTSGYVRIYGAEIEVTYTASNVPVTGVTLDKSADSIEIGETTTLTATVAPSNATNKTVTWSTSNSSVATVSNGIITGVAQGSARITVTTADGGFTDYCDVTVTKPITYDYILTSSMQPGKKYLIADGNSGTVHLLSNVSGGSRILTGVTATVTNNRLSITKTVQDQTEFECVRYTSGNDNTITVKSDNKYLYCDNASGLRMNAPTTLDRFWHYRNNKFWQFKSTSSDGYSDTSTEYKYYLNISNGNFTDNHVTSPSIENSSLPLIYIFTEDDGGGGNDAIYYKNGNNWVEVTEVYKKVNGSWVLQQDLTSVFSSGTNYRKGN